MKTLFERAFDGEAVERTPVWAMRQAGRWDPQFQKLRAGMSFFDFSAEPELAARASLCPLRFGVDAIILFYDIATVAIAMGQDFRLVAGAGPVPDRPIRTMADVEALAADPTDHAAARAVRETLRLVKADLPAEVPPLVFAGAPFTLASYMIGTGKHLPRTRAFAAEHPGVWSALLQKVAAATSRFIRPLLADGAVAWQLFDSWAGQLTREEYRAWALPHHQRIFAETGGRSLLFVKDCPFLEERLDSGATGLSLCLADDLVAIRRLRPTMPLQGNVDHLLLVHGTEREVADATKACLENGGCRGHILNLDHGMDRGARPEHFATYVETARSWRPDERG